MLQYYHRKKLWSNGTERGTTMLWKRKEQTDQKIPYDPAKQTAVLKCSICNGEQVAGFQDIESGKFQEVMLIQNEADLKRFRQTYGLSEIKKIY